MDDILRRELRSIQQRLMNLSSRITEPKDGDIKDELTGGRVDTLMLWEILVPTMHRKTGRPIRTRFHRVWDAKVRAVTGGLSIWKPIMGEWVGTDGALFRDRMIPVRIAATESQMAALAQMTMEYYKELSVMYYKVSGQVYFTTRTAPHEH